MDPSTAGTATYKPVAQHVYHTQGQPGSELLVSQGSVTETQSTACAAPSQGMQVQNRSSAFKQWGASITCGAGLPSGLQEENRNGQPAAMLCADVPLLAQQPSQVPVNLKLQELQEVQQPLIFKGPDLFSVTGAAATVTPGAPAPSGPAADVPTQRSDSNAVVDPSCSESPAEQPLVSVATARQQLGDMCLLDGQEELSTDTESNMSQPEDLLEIFVASTTEKGCQVQLLMPTKDNSSGRKGGKRSASVAANGGEEDPTVNGNGTNEINGAAGRNKKPRLIWTPELHARFVNAVNQLGLKNAVPKTILQIMNVEGMTRENVASHLQKYRLYLKRTSAAPSSTLLQPDMLQHAPSLQQPVAPAAPIVPALLQQQLLQLPTPLAALQQGQRPLLLPQAAPALALQQQAQLQQLLAPAAAASLLVPPAAAGASAGAVPAAAAVTLSDVRAQTVTAGPAAAAVATPASSAAASRPGDATAAATTISSSGAQQHQVALAPAAAAAAAAAALGLPGPAAAAPPLPLHALSALGGGLPLDVTAGAIGPDYHELIKQMIALNAVTAAAAAPSLPLGLHNPLAAAAAVQQQLPGGAAAAALLAAAALHAPANQLLYPAAQALMLPLGLCAHPLGTLGSLDPSTATATAALATQPHVGFVNPLHAANISTLLNSQMMQSAQLQQHLPRTSNGATASVPGSG